LNPNSTSKSCRAFGWFNVNFGIGSSVKIKIPLAPINGKFQTLTNIHLVNVDISSSVTFESFLKVPIFQMDINREIGLEWNGRTVNKYTIISEEMEIFLLRRQISLIQDLVTDFSTGPTQLIETFVPNTYQINCNITDFSIFTNINHNNIIEVHNDLDLNSTDF
jgi:hypothetical protein